jgi:hypothetical protein
MGKKIICIILCLTAFRKPEVMTSGKDRGKEGEPKTPAIPNHLQRLTAKPLGKQEETVSTIEAFC